MDEMVKNQGCRLCSSEDFFQVDGYGEFERVTSDCRPWRSGGKLAFCKACGLVQKISDSAFCSDCADIYKRYSVYHQGHGQEQAVFEQSNGASLVRSEKLLREVFKKFTIGQKGRLLDVGCGNGNLLKSFSNFRSDWSLAGSELDDRYKDAVLRVENVEAFYSCPVEQIDAKFDMVSMLHCLEHIEQPLEFLRKIRAKLTDGGLLLVEVPNHVENPFDLIIADHCSHFSMDILGRLIGLAGFEVVFLVTDCVAKEITLLAKKSNDRLVTKVEGCNTVDRPIGWLKKVIEFCSELSKEGDFGIFGTAVAGVWIACQFRERVKFFVDEDPARVGKEFMDCAVYHPDELGNDSKVFIGLPYKIAVELGRRMGTCGGEYILPPVY